MFPIRCNAQIKLQCRCLDDDYCAEMNRLMPFDGAETVPCYHKDLTYLIRELQASCLELSNFRYAITLLTGTMLRIDDTCPLLISRCVNRGTCTVPKLLAAEDSLVLRHPRYIRCRLNRAVHTSAAIPSGDCIGPSNKRKRSCHAFVGRGSSKSNKLDR